VGTFSNFTGRIWRHQKMKNNTQKIARQYKADIHTRNPQKKLRKQKILLIARYGLSSAAVS
jgi:hypothetical protein